MPHYKKVFDIGTYTGNGGIYRVGIPTIRLPGPSGKQVANSIRFRQSVSAYMQRTSASTVTDGKKFTVSVWIKGRLSSPIQNRTTIYATTSNNGLISLDNYSYTQKMFVRHDASNDIRFDYIMDDQSRWYHLMIVTDTTSATAAERTVAYIDGKKIYSTAGSQPSQNYAGYLNATSTTNWIGYDVNNWYSDMYMSEYYFIDGQALTPSSFGEYNSDGIWVPKGYSGSYGSNGFYLQFAPGAAGTDSSGNGNNWTLNNFNTTTSNNTYDLLTSSPTDYLSGSMTTANNAGNYCVISSIDTYATAGGWSVTNGGLYLTSSATLGSVRGTIGFSSGKWYWEVKYINGNSSEIAGISTPTSTSAGGSAGGIGYYVNGSIYINGSASAYGTSVSAGDIIGVAVDMDNGKIWFSRNGTWQNSGDPAAGTNPGTTGLSGTYYPGFEDAASGTNATFEANFGQRTFAYTPPTGFKSLNTYNIPRPADSSLWFYGDSPDLIWIKDRSASRSHSLNDSVRGAGLDLSSELTAVDYGSGVVSEWNKFGMTVVYTAGNYRTNTSAENFVYWAWKAGGQAVTNTDGTIASLVSANRQAGFSIVTWTGTGTSGQTVGHGLGNDTPELVIVKKRNKVENWYVAAYPLDNSWNYAYHLFLNTTGAKNGNNDPYYFNNAGSSTAPTLSLNDGSSLNGGNESGIHYVAYCWNSVPGYSAFGSYTGNGSADGPFVYLGFRPRYLLIKRTDGGTQSWWILDTTTDSYNVMSKGLTANAADAESSGNTWADALSNGFKLRTTSIGVNTSSGTYIYAAFAEIPFKFARAR